MGWREDFEIIAGGSGAAVAATALFLADAIAADFPDLTPAAKPGWRAVTFRHARAGFVCGVFARPTQATLVFEHGRLLSDPEGLLEGTTRQVRQISFPPGRHIDMKIIDLYIAEAIALRA